jgi:uridylate kinase
MVLIQLDLPEYLLKSKKIQHKGAEIAIVIGGGNI